MSKLSEKLLVILPFCLIVYGFTGGLSNDIYLPAMPKMVDYLSTNNSMIQLTLTSWGLGVGVFQLFMGPWSDHYGRRPALILGGFIFLIGSIGCAMAPNAWTLLIARFVQGMGTCSMFMITLTAIKEVFTEEKRVKWLVYYNMMRSLAPLIGPVLGAYILLAYSWRGVFVFIAGFAALGLIGLLIALPETNPRDHNNSFNVREILANYKTSFKDKYLMRYLSTSALIFSGLMVYLTTGAFIMIERIGMSEQAFAYSQAAISGAYILGAACVQRGYKLFGAHKVIMTGIVSCLLGATALMLITFWHEGIYTVLLPIALYSFGFGMCSAPLTERTLAHEGVKAGLVAGLIGFSITVGSTISTFLASIMPDAASVTGLLMLAFAATAMVIYRSRLLVHPHHETR